MLVTKQQWIEVGYQQFSRFGIDKLTVEGLARKMGVSKSSYYHHFAEQKVFLNELMAMHLRQSQIIADKEKRAQNIEPDLIHILLEHKTDLLFNKQLRIHNHQPLFKETLRASDFIVGNEFILLWIRDSQLPITINQASGLFALALENFYLKLNENTFNKEWLIVYFNELKTVVQLFVR
jgi:AcrR family transcriptional regulator